MAKQTVTITVTRNEIEKIMNGEIVSLKIRQSIKTNEEVWLKLDAPNNQTYGYNFNPFGGNFYGNVNGNIF